MYVICMYVYLCMFVVSVIVYYVTCTKTHTRTGILKVNKDNDSN